MPEFTHMDPQGRVRMVDVTEKQATVRRAVAQACVTLSPETFDHVMQQTVQKGNVLETARIAGIMAAKKTADLIPMCHPLNISHAQVDFFPDESTRTIRIQSDVRLQGQTGVEMEALTAVSVAALTIYDMCKALDKGIRIDNMLLLEKSGGKSGHYTRPVPEDPAHGKTTP